MVTISRRFVLAVLVGLAVLAAGASARGTLYQAPASLPEKLTDQQFWQLSDALSEPNGQFQSDNLLSNEMVFARIVPDLISRTQPGGVYLGVGPEQNFTYIAAIKPRMAFITDIRRGNLELQLMYKALFELSADRAEFVSRLFTKPRPAGLSGTSTARELMNAYWNVTSSDEETYNANLKAIDDELTKTHKLPLAPEDLEGIAGVYRAFYWYGPSMNYSANVALTSTNGGYRPGVTYADLMTQEGDGEGLSYLASEDKFNVLKNLERQNLIVPVVGNFSGPKALRAEGRYLRDHGATVTAFYLSNVEMYLRRAGTWSEFCGNVATMPLDDHSLFIRPGGGMFRVYGVNSSGATFIPPNGSVPGVVGLVPMAEAVKDCSGGGGR